MEMLSIYKQVKEYKDEPVVQSNSRNPERPKLGLWISPLDYLYRNAILQGSDGLRGRWLQGGQGQEQENSQGVGMGRWQGAGTRIGTGVGNSEAKGMKGE